MAKIVGKWLKYEEIMLIVTGALIGVGWLLLHWLDPQWSPIAYWLASGGLYKGLVHKFTLAPYVWPTIHRLERHLAIVLRLVAVLTAAYLGWRFAWRQMIRRRMRTYRIVLSRDDLAAPLTVSATFDAWAKVLRTRYLSLLLGNYPCSLMIAKQHTMQGKKGEIILLLRAPEKYFGVLGQRLQATWTSVRLESYAREITFPSEPVTAIFRPQKDTATYGFRAYRDYNHSITESIVQVIDSMDEDTVLEIPLKPLPARFETKAMKKVHKKEYEYGENQFYNPADPGMGILDQAQLQAVSKTAGRSWYRTEIRVVAPNLAVLQAINGALAEASAENALEYHRVWLRRKWQIVLMKSGMPGFFPFWWAFPMNGIFLATIWQLPSARLRTPGLTRASTRRGPGAIGLDREVGGCTPIQDEAGPVTVKEDDRKSGVLTIGQQGTGKSTVLEQIAYHDFREDKAVIILDPKGQMADRLRDFVPQGRRVATWKLSQAEVHQWGWNPFLQDIDSSVLISGVLASMRQIWGEQAIGPRSADFLRLAMGYVLQTGRSAQGFAAVDEFLEHPETWEAAAGIVGQPLQGWLRAEAARFSANERFFTEALAAPKNKLREFLFYPKVRENLIPEKSLDLGRIIDDKGILIVSLAPGDNLHMQDSDLIATLLVTSIWDTIRRKGSLLRNVKTSLILDEAHRMVCDALSNAMAEGRSYGIQMSVGLQFLTQIKDETLRDSITELLQHLFLFRSNLIKETEDYSKLFSRVYSNMMSPDAELQDKLQFGPDDRFNLPQFNALCRLVVDGTPKPAFLGQTIPLFPSDERDQKLPWGTCPPEWLLSAERSDDVLNISICKAGTLQTASPEPEAKAQNEPEPMPDPGSKQKAKPEPQPESKPEPVPTPAPEKKNSIPEPVESLISETNLSRNDYERLVKLYVEKDVQYALEKARDRIAKVQESRRFKYTEAIIRSERDKKLKVKEEGETA